ncbi:MAG TPA: hypothetical protein VKA48_11005 [Gammaproteobacteria bacterium]|nr:hypothetical protein [Gammaproteobacteria bacterium]
MTSKRQHLQDREEALLERIQNLPEEERRTFYRRLGEEVRHPGTYTFLNLLFPLGLHHFYLHRRARGFLDVGGVVLGTASLIAGAPILGLALVLGVVVMELPQLSRARRIVAEHNLALQENLLEEVTSGKRSTPVHPSYF